MPKVIDLFAGAGGFGLGFQLAGYELCLSLEIDLWAAKTLSANKPKNTIVINDDIRKYRTENQILNACQRVVPDVIIGGPPCQGFSIAGPAHKKDPKDPRNSLFREFARWVKFLQPQIFVMENVKGILSRINASKERVIEIIEKTFLDLGYFVEIWELNAAEYGAPQIRERVFIMGHKLGREMGKPPATHMLLKGDTEGTHLEPKMGNNGSLAICVWDAISDLPTIEACEGEEEQPYSQNPISSYQEWARGEQQILYNHVAMRHTGRMVERFKLIKWGQSVSDVPEEHQARKRNGNGEISESAYDSNNRRLNPFTPSYTIPAHFYSSFIHPYQHRNITAREAARLQSFPDYYIFKGKRTVISRKLLERWDRHDENHLSQYNQIGNAVPPLLAKAIAEHIFTFLTSG